MLEESNSMEDNNSDYGEYKPLPMNLNAPTSF